ncbi:F0F1 ATP synthase subunit gamma [Sphingobium sp. SA2]|jgi:F-type H+-transporting ATPase subunit gamma|nr:MULTISPECIES: F0F1 ATP synthase subunit gamma [unclassified Sphingobium]MDE0946094.1 F0F1 ATP synthase subunit gamma [Sphingobium sp.]OHC93569.1 MAG: F0F1 ATP synthase subunit gamma [Sphingomonadales bacterium RIFCSPLOWO2_12_FULL_63_15]AOF96983.1 ATP synthase F1, gamma subunit [Sphingobium sp. RAC03]KFL48443.1 F-type H+-transporting ATPase gamma chain [Sphingobium sp. ba1]MDT7534616.1 F0F1 ATP synthase subunit gamma [Sphingobium sp. SA2]|tara:strand:- start:6692 stop:7576 length:885 start_codon:yes stop_codon:yes gene_type:complete
MASLKELKIRIGSVKSTQKITKAKQMVAAAKLRKAQAAAEAARPYSSRLEAVVASLASKIAGGSGEGASPLLAGTGKDEVHLLVVANSDRGLAGAFNANIVKAARVKADALIEQGKTVKFYLIGRKGRPVINRLYPGAIVAQFDTTGAKQPGYDQAQAIANELTTMYLDGKFDMAHLFYSRFKSALSQIPTEQQIIPVKIPADADRNAIGATVEYEPSEEAILDDLLPRNIAIQLFKALLENNASEQGASMNAMDNATRNAGDLINKLTIQYNRSRQAAITTELVEIISGAEAL